MECTNLINSCHAGNEFGCGKEGMVNLLSIYLVPSTAVCSLPSLKQETCNLLCKSVIVCVHCIGLYSSEGSAVLGAHTQH